MSLELQECLELSNEFAELGKVILASKYSARAGYLLILEGSFEKARECLHRALDLNPENDNALFLLRVHFEKNPANSMWHREPDPEIRPPYMPEIAKDPVYRDANEDDEAKS